MATLETGENTEEQSMRVLLEKISAYIQHLHGGSVEMNSFDGMVLKVRLGGACLGCPLSPVTLHGCVEGTVHQFFPDVRVESVSESRLVFRQSVSRWESDGYWNLEG